MKAARRLLAALLISSIITPLGTACAQSTAFTYQGRLSDNGVLANGAYDLRFILYNSSAGGGQQGPILTNTATAVSNGLFIVTLDFGSQFAGADRWLEIASRTNGPGPQGFVTLSPRQSLTPAPYALFANASSNLSGTLPAGQLSGTIANSNLPSDPSFSGTVHAGSGFGIGADVRNSWNNQDANSVNPLPRNLPAGSVPQSTGPYQWTGVAATAANTPGAIVQRDNAGSFAAATIRGTFSGDGSTLSNLNASQLSSGTVPAAALGNTWKTTGNSGTSPGFNFLGTTDNQPLLLQAAFVGVGRTNKITGVEYFGINAPVQSGSYGGMYVNTTNANALPFYGYSLAGGANAFHYLDGSDGNKWKLNNVGTRLTVTPSGNVGINTTTPTETLEINGTSRLDDNDMFLRTVTDRNHGVGYRNAVTGISVDGPFLYGFNGGGLGVSAPDTLTLKWDFAGNVWVSNDCSVATLSCRGGASFVGNVGVGTGTPAAPLDVEGNDGSGSFNAPVALIQNANTSGSAAPALRVVGWGNTAYGALSVSANGTGLIAQFGNFSSFVADIRTNGTVDAVVFNPTSDRNAKQNFDPVDPQQILQKVVTLPISQWNYKIAKEVRHVGPMAQDFYAAFAVGSDDQHIATVDADGVALAAIQGLNQKVESGRRTAESLEHKLELKETEITELKQTVAQLKELVQALDQKLSRIKSD